MSELRPELTDISVLWQSNLRIVKILLAGDLAVALNYVIDECSPTFPLANASYVDLGVVIMVHSQQLYSGTFLRNCSTAPHCRTTSSVVHDAPTKCR